MKTKIFALAVSTIILAFGLSSFSMAQSKGPQENKMKNDKKIEKTTDTKSMEKAKTTETQKQVTEKKEKSEKEMNKVTESKKPETNKPVHHTKPENKTDKKIESTTQKK